MAERPDQSLRAYSARLYQPTLRSIPKGISTLLASYSSIAEEAQKEHITRIRDQAYTKHPYPCLGRWRFLDLDLSIHPLYYTDILPALKPYSDPESEPVSEAAAVKLGIVTKDQTWVFLDLGCCLGQDIRKLIFDGAEASRLRGADLRPEFIDLGYDLFGDRDRFPSSRFITPADVFDLSPSAPLAQLDGTVGILHVCAVFHLFDLAGQKALAHRVLRLLARNARGIGQQQEKSNDSTTALLVGAQTANVNPGEFERRPGDGQWKYRHNDASWRAFWEEAIAHEEWAPLIKNVQVGSLLEARTSGLGDLILSTADNTNNNNNTSTTTTTTINDANSNTSQRQIGLVEEGFRWMKWWVWVTFANK